MADDEGYQYEDGEAGASATIPTEAGQIVRGGYIMLKGRPCKVVSVYVAETGKHGDAKCAFTAIDIFTGVKLEDMFPSGQVIEVPAVHISDWTIVQIEEGGELTLMDDGGNQMTYLSLPTYPEDLATQIRDAWNGGENVVIVQVQSAVGEEQVISFHM